MKDATEPVRLHILGKEYRVVCPCGEEESLLTAARYLNDQMKEIKNSGKVIGVERVAVMAALNITHELLQERNQKERVYEQDKRIQILQRKVEAALEDCN